MPRPATTAALTWERLQPDAAGLVTAVVQHAHTGQVLMVAHMNREALERTLTHARVCFWSRSRQTLWEKGETSGHSLDLVGLRVDCDGDALLLTALPRGPTCHTGTVSCFHWRKESNETLVHDDNLAVEIGVLAAVYEEILCRQRGEGITSPTGTSYVRSVLEGGVPSVNAKLIEEAVELAAAVRSEPDAHVAAEAADLVFHCWIALAARGVSLVEVCGVLARRLGRSGIDERAARGA